MTVVQAIFLGIIQGLTEFMPISSSGHLVLAHHFLQDGGGLYFDAALNIGTVSALVLYFYKDILTLVKAIFTKQKETKLAWLLVAATVPAAVAGVLLEKSAANAFRSPKLVVINLMLVAVIMLVAEWYYQRHERQATQLDDISTAQALVMGVSQAAALVPGVSRSGGTISGGLFMGMNRVAATRFSFLLGIPIMIGGLGKLMLEPQFTQAFQAQQSMFIIGIIAAFISGMIAIRFLLGYLAKHSLSIFAYYRLTLGSLVLLVLFLNR